MSKTERYTPHRQLRERLSDSTEREYNRGQNWREIAREMSEYEQTVALEQDFRDVEA